MPRIPNTTTFTDFHLEDCPQASVDPVPQDDDDAGPRIVISTHSFSRAQAAYVAARHAEPNAPIFYKDATPRAEHYVRCGVRVEGVNHGVSVPVKLELCFPDGRVVAPTFEPRPGKDADALKVLGDGCKRFVLQSPGDVRFFDYRIELGSLRADDRKFCVKISPDAHHVQGVMPAITPGLLVLSKKRIFPGQECVPVGSGPAAPSGKRARTGGSPRASDDESGHDAQLVRTTQDILTRMTELEKHVKALTTAVYAVLAQRGPHAALVSASGTPSEGLSRSGSFDGGHSPGGMCARPVVPHGAMPAPGLGEQPPSALKMTALPPIPPPTQHQVHPLGTYPAFPPQAVPARSPPRQHHQLPPQQAYEPTLYNFDTYSPTGPGI